MGSRLNNMMTAEGAAYIYTENYMNYMAMHMKFIREHVSTATVTLDPALVYKNMNDFTGLFLDMGYKKEIHQTLLQLNGFSNPNELTEEVEKILIPAVALIAQLNLLYQTSSS